MAKRAVKVECACGEARVSPAARSRAAFVCEEKWINPYGALLSETVHGRDACAVHYARTAFGGEEYHEAVRGFGWSRVSRVPSWAVKFFREASK